MKARPVVWSRKAAEDLLEVLTCIRQDSPTAAQKVLDPVDRRLRAVSRFSQLGRPVAELADQSPEVRQVVIGEYRLVYRSAGDRVEVMQLILGRRRFP